MRLYHKYLHEYATLISRSVNHYAVKYDGSDQIRTAPIRYFEVVEDEVPYWYDDFAMHCEGHV